LDVVGSTRVYNSSTDTALVVNCGNGSFATIEAMNNANNAKKNVCISPYGGNVGIGVTNPQYLLDVSATSTAPFRVGVGSTNAIAVNSSGQVGIGSTTPQSALDVTGAIRVSGGITPTYSTFPTFTSGQVGYTYSYSMPSSVSAGTNTFTISVPVGTYIAFAYIELQGNQTMNSWHAIDIAGARQALGAAPPFSNYCYLTAISCVISVSSTSSINYTVNSPVPSTLGVCLYKIVRIA
jgi:hypothetical protein